MNMAAAPTVTFEGLRNQIRHGKLAPVYILHGEEGFYTDTLVKDFEGVLSPDDKEFNFNMFYAPEVSMPQVIEQCCRYPIMADRQMVILKEAQAVRADIIDQLASYLKNPTPTTVLVIVFRKAVAKGKEFMAAAKSKAVVFESKKVKDYNLPQLITAAIQAKGLGADPKAVEMLRDFIGTDLSTLYNEIDKLATILGKGATVTPEAVERNIGISKEFNNFELVDALAIKDAGKAMRIAEYFAANPKATSLVLTTALLYNFFSDLLVIIYTKDKTDQGLCQALNLKSTFPLKRFRAALQKYNAFQLIEIIWALREFDCRCKGIGSRQDENDLFRELIFHILTAPGTLFK